MCESVQVSKGYGRGSKKLGVPTANLPESQFKENLRSLPTGDRRKNKLGGGGRGERGGVVYVWVIGGRWIKFGREGKGGGVVCGWWVDGFLGRGGSGSLWVVGGFS